MSDCGYRCYEIGGPWIAENPDCPEHSNAWLEAPGLAGLWTEHHEERGQRPQSLAFGHKRVEPGELMYDYMKKNLHRPIPYIIIFLMLVAAACARDEHKPQPLGCNTEPADASRT